MAFGQKRFELLVSGGEVEKKAKALDSPSCLLLPQVCTALGDSVLGGDRQCCWIHTALSIVASLAGSCLSTELICR